jgi:hypothetical protein
MPRPAKRESSGKANKPNGKKQLNTALAEQLVLDFNKAAAEHGRDALLESLIFRFLEKTRPSSPSVLQFRQKAQKAAGSEVTNFRLDDDVAAELDVMIEQREALMRVRELATQIVEVSTAALRRRPPKSSPSAPKPEGNRAVS